MAFFANGTFAEGEWGNLELADADRIISFSKMPTTLVAEVDRRLNPEELRIIESFEKITPRLDVGMQGHGIEVSAVQALLKQFPADHFLSFQIGSQCPPEVRQFCATNFGRDDNWTPTVFPTATPYEFSALEDIQKVTYGVDHVGHVVDFLTSLAQGRQKLRRIIAACQIGSVLEQLPVPLGGLEQAFQVIIGDSPADLVEHWDGGRWKHNWYRPYAHQLWLPSELARQPTVMQAVIGYALACNADNWFGEPRQRIELTSWSWSEAELQQLLPLARPAAGNLEIAVVLPDQLQARRRAHVQERLAFPRSLLRNDPATTRLSGHRPVDQWEVPEPALLQMLRTKSGSGSWCVDVLIEQPRPEDSPAHADRWWLLPRKSGGRLTRGIFERPARITRAGYFAVSFQYTATQGKRHTLQVTRPSSPWLFNWMFWPRAEHEWGSPYDERAKLSSEGPLIRYLGDSDKGNYLSGLIALFGDLDGAREFTGRKYWRETFERLAGQERKEDPELVSNIARVILKKLPHEKNRQELVQATAERVVRFVGQRLTPQSVSRRELAERYAAYAAASGLTGVGPAEPVRSMAEQRQRPLSEEGMKRQLSWLVARDIVRLGVQLHCTRCGVRSWVHVDQAKQHLICAGCAHEQALDGEPEWHYELNSLALRCVTSNQLAALQALCHLALRASHSFAYSTSREIFRDQEQKPWHEIDLICLCDGRLIVAEVKDTAVVEGDLQELAEIAEALRADEALLFLPAGQITAKPLRWKDEISARLARSHIAFSYVGLTHV